MQPTMQRPKTPPAGWAPQRGGEGTVALSPAGSFLLQIGDGGYCLILANSCDLLDGVAPVLTAIDTVACAVADPPGAVEIACVGTAGEKDLAIQP